MNGSERIVRQPARLRTRAARRGHDARAECRRVREPSPFAPAGERRPRRRAELDVLASRYCPINAGNGPAYEVGYNDLNTIFHCVGHSSRNLPLNDSMYAFCVGLKLFLHV